METANRKSLLYGLAATVAVALTGCVVEGPPVERERPERPVYVERPPVVHEQAPVYVEPAPQVEGEIIYIDEYHHGHLHDYYYYPDVQVYFDPIATYWFWLDNGHWIRGRDLPHRFHPDEGHRFFMHTDARQPYMVHDRVVRRAYERRNFHGAPGRGPEPRGPEHRPDMHDNRPEVHGQPEMRHDEHPNQYGRPGMQGNGPGRGYDGRDHR